tara:strand:+ start:19993 stop:20880 length:888 start_codon:yes stop_codon:yes gene_type:complete
MSNNSVDYPPIVIFAYNRPKKLKNLMLSLEENREFKDFNVHFFVDKFKDDSDKKKNDEVLKIIKEKWKCNSKEININDENLGLKNNILNGINTIFNNHDSAIFLEDDLVVSKSFLDYMIKSLKIYKNEKKIMHISGYNFKTFIGKKTRSYFSRNMNCWGWATWKKTWENNNNFQENIISSLKKKDRRLFNIYGFEKDYESQLIRNQKGEISTWAIYWYQFIFIQNGLCLQPIKSLVNNTGADGSGVHNSQPKIYSVKLNDSNIKIFPEKYSFTIFNKLQVISFYMYKKAYKILSS